MLRQKARAVYDGRDESEQANKTTVSSEHINFFEDLEKGDDQVVKPNSEYEKEKKEEKEKYEKQIGYLTYLGQDTNEATGNVSWYNKMPERHSEDTSEILVEKKARYDPLLKMNHYLGKPNDFADAKKKCVERDIGEESKQKNHKKKKKKRKRKHSSSDSNSESEISSKPKPSIDELRAKRMKRENEEKLRAAALLAKLRGDILPEVEKAKEPIIKQKYNSQFNPHIAKQNTFV